MSSVARLVYSANENQSGQWIPSPSPEEGLSGGGGGGTSDVMEARVKALESKFERIDGKLDKLIETIVDFRLKTADRLGGIETRLTGIETGLATKATGEAVAKIGGDLALKVQSVEKDLGTKASAEGMANLKGAVDKLPTTIVLMGFVLTVLGIAGILKFLV